MKIIQTTDYELIATLNQSVQELHSELYPKYFKEYDFEVIKDFFKKSVTNPDFIFLVIEDNGQYLGYAWLEIKEYRESVFIKSYRSLFIHHISVVKSHIRNGYGSKLMDKIYEIANANKLEKIELDYWYNNQIAKEFYKKSGFKIYREYVYKEL